MHSLIKFLVLCVVAFSAVGCGHRYHFRGHHSGNLQNPPDVQLKIGQSKTAVTEGVAIKALVPAFGMIQIEDETVARISPDSFHEAKIEALRPGVTRAKYALEEEPNQGFRIIVVPYFTEKTN